MTGYLFSPVANRRLNEIWDYTASRWGHGQAETYVQGLYGHLDRLAKRQLPWRVADKLPFTKIDPPSNLYVTRYSRHYVFFYPRTDGRLGIVTLMHEKMDMLSRLQDDLKG